MKLVLTQLRQEDIQIGVTPKEEVYREDKILLYRFKPKVEHSLNIPILIIYAEQDHLVPPASSLALETYIGSADYTVRSLELTH